MITHLTMERKLTLDKPGDLINLVLLIISNFLHNALVTQRVVNTTRLKGIYCIE
jgi:hypothetical protein